MDSDTTSCCCESSTESYTSDNSYTHSGPLFVSDNKSSSMTDITDCDTDTDTDEKVQIRQNHSPNHNNFESLRIYQHWPINALPSKNIMWLSGPHHFPNFNQLLFTLLEWV